VEHLGETANTLRADGDVSGVVVQARYIAEINLRTGVPVRTRYLHQVKSIAPPELVGRGAELAELAEFATAPGGGAYRWWRAGAWAGKSALMSWFVLHPPEGVRIVSFFITARLAGQADRTAFVDNILEQLLAILGEEPPATLTPSTREAHLLGLLDEAAEACRNRGERLLLLVDGLDEDRGVTTDPGAHSIAALLPESPPAGMRVVVAGRPDPPVPTDVAPGHPLRDPAIVRVLSVSHAALARRSEMERDLGHLLDGTQVQLDLLGLLVAAGGGLTTTDLATLTDTHDWAVRRHLTTVAGRSFTQRASEHSAAAAAPVYLLAHEELHATAVDMIGPRHLAAYRDRLHEWAATWRRADWPADTPEYLLHGYHTLLLTTGDRADLDRATALSTDPHRHHRCLATTGADTAAIAQINAVLDHHATRIPPDLTAMARLAVHRDHLIDRNGAIPAAVPAVWAALGHHRRAMLLAQSISNPGTRVEALIEVAKELTRIGDRTVAVELIDDAVAALPAVTNPLMRESYESAIAIAYAQAGEHTIAVDRLTTFIDRSERLWPAIEVARALIAAGNSERALELLLDHDTAGRYDPLRSAMAEAVYAAGDRPRALTTLAAALRTAEAFDDPFFRSLALCEGARVLARVGDRDQAVTVLVDAVDATRVTESHRWRTRALVEVAEVLEQLGDRDAELDVLHEAATVAAAVVQPAERCGLLTDVATRLAAAGARQQARAIVADAADILTTIAPGFEEESLAGLAIARMSIGESILAINTAMRLTDARDRSRTLASVARKSIETGGDREFAVRALDEATTTARAITDTGTYDRALAAVATAQARAGDFVTAVALTDTIINPTTRVTAAKAVARSLIAAGHLSQAHEVLDAAAAAGRTAVPSLKAKMLAGIAVVMAEACADDMALTALAEAVDAAVSVSSRDARDDLLWSVAAAQARISGQEVALSTAAAITSPILRDQALVNVLYAQRDAGEVLAAYPIATTITDVFQRFCALVAVATALIESEDHGQASGLIAAAAELIDAIGPPNNIFARITLAKVHAQHGKHQLAMQVVGSLVPNNRQEALDALVGTYCQAGDRTLALATANAMESPPWRSRALAEIVEAHCRAGDGTAASDLLTAIICPDHRVRALVAIARMRRAAQEQSAARACLADALDTARSIPDADDRSWSMTDIALELLNVGESVQAGTVVAEALRDGRWSKAAVVLSHADLPACHAMFAEAAQTMAS
jgi:tetratricopeptide (TPR) repeat protein